jgi:dephospho-CoA kinase
MTAKKAIVGVTGIIGSGKTTVSQFLGDLGAAVFDSDRVARDVTNEADIQKKIRAKFGSQFFDEHGELIRRKLGEMVFKDYELLQQLNQLIHPRVRQKMWEFVHQQQHDETREMIVIDSPLIYETDLHTYLNFIVVVVASEETCIQRVLQRNELSRDEIVSRMNRQMPLSEKIKRAQFRINNDGDLSNLPDQVKNVYFGILNRWSSNA